MTDQEIDEIESANFRKYYREMTPDQQRDADCLNPMAGVHYSFPKARSAIYARQQLRKFAEQVVATKDK